MRPTRNSKETGRLPFAEANSLPIWACWRWGLPCDDCHQSPGALLPHHFTLTCEPFRARTAPSAVSFLWHYPSGRPGSPLATTVPCPVRTFLTQCQRTWRANALPTPLPGAGDLARCLGSPQGIIHQVSVEIDNGYASTTACSLNCIRSGLAGRLRRGLRFA